MQVSKAGTRAVQAVALEFASELNSLADDIARQASNKANNAEDLIESISVAIEALKGDIAPKIDQKLDELNTRYIKYADI